MNKFEKWLTQKKTLPVFWGVHIIVVYLQSFIHPVTLWFFPSFPLFFHPFLQPPPFDSFFHSFSFIPSSCILSFIHLVLSFIYIHVNEVQSTCIYWKFKFLHFSGPTPCQRHAQEATGSSILVGAYIPQCTPSGDYEPRQCHGSTGFCWCVNLDGEEIFGTRRGPGQEVVCDGK